MLFKSDKAIYLQIADYIMDEILSEKFKENDRVPSVRDLAVEIEVNPNTVVQSYNWLQERDIIFNQRGVGYFVGPDARTRVKELEKENFLNEQLPGLFKSMHLLNVNIKDIEKHYKAWVAENKRGSNEKK